MGGLKHLWLSFHIQGSQSRALSGRSAVSPGFRSVPAEWLDPFGRGESERAAEGQWRQSNAALYAP